MDNDKFRALHDGKCGKPNAINLLFGDGFEPILLYNLWGSFMSLGFPHYGLFSGRCTCIYIYICACVPCNLDQETTFPG